MGLAHQDRLGPNYICNAGLNGDKPFFFSFDPVTRFLHMCEPNLNAWQLDRCPGPANICGVCLAEVLQLCTSTTVAGMEKKDVEIVLQQNISKQRDWQKPKHLQTNK